MSASAPEPDSMSFDLLPADPGLISPDLALDAALAGRGSPARRSEAVRALVAL